MNTVNISYDELSKYIGDLKSMRESWVTGEGERKSMEPTLSGKGKSASALDLLVTEYDSVNSAMLMLIDNTIAFFTNVLNSAKAADENASQALSSGGASGPSGAAVTRVNMVK